MGQQDRQPDSSGDKVSLIRTQLAGTRSKCGDFPNSGVAASSPFSISLMFDRRRISYLLLVGLLLASSFGNALHHCCGGGGLAETHSDSCCRWQNKHACGSFAPAQRVDDKPAKDEIPCPSDGCEDGCAICMLLASPALLIHQAASGTLPDTTSELLVVRDMAFRSDASPGGARPRGPPVL